MTTVAEFTTSTYTFVSTDSVRFDIDTNNGEQALVRVNSGSSTGAIVFQAIVTTTRIIGPFNAGDVLTVYAQRGAVDYTIVNQEAIHELSDAQIAALQSMLVGNVDAIANVDATTLQDQQLIYAKDVKSFYLYDASSVAAASQDLVVVPAVGSGRLLLHVPGEGSIINSVSGAVVAARGSTVGRYDKITNTGTSPGYGRRYQYKSTAYGAFDLAEAAICKWNRTNGQAGGTGMTDWRVAVSPKNDSPSDTYSRTVIAEWNVVNRDTDTGWQAKRAALNYSTGFINVVPEAVDFFSDGGDPKNVLFGLMFSAAPASSETTRIGFKPRVYNGLLFEPNSIHETGYPIYASGSDGTDGVGGGAPVAIVGAAQSWQSGFRTTSATFSVDAYVLGASQGQSWLDGSNNLLHRQYVDANASVIEGRYASPRGVKNTKVWAPTKRNADYDTQVRQLLLYRSAGANPSNIPLSTDGAGTSATNSLILPASGSVRISGFAHAKSGTPASAGWKVDVLARRNSGTTVTVVSSTITKDTSDAGAADWVLTAVANNTLGSVEFQISGTGTINVSVYATVLDLV